MKTSLLLLTGLTFLTLFSCKKLGCSDIDAINYDSEVKPKNSSNCQYSGEVVFWHGQAVAEFLISDGATGLFYYVNGEMVGSASASTYWTGRPDCGANGSVTVTKELGAVKNKTYSYSIIDQTGYEYASGVVNFTANTCQSVELN